MSGVDGQIVRAGETPPSASDADDTVLAQITNDVYLPGIPEVGTTFVAPASGRVRMTVSAGLRDNGTAPRARIFVSPQVFRGTSAAGVEVLAPSVTFRGVASNRENVEFQYGSRVALMTGLTPGETYYARLMHLATPIADPSDTADIAVRDITVIPVP
ncbi:hypothetical protein [Nonomuraea soli]|uniref:Uncharacterized protein n=1 Tax=Nonomuraea soli TaxID=1032476 RepID=A0A7W0HW27_9ACTN|nr:hypothetical protein [Nonomuraea soli]MBA2897401.1 hypothetical protein [Nonomuraea soli]